MGVRAPLGLGEQGEGGGGKEVGALWLPCPKKKIAKSYSFSTDKKLFRPWRCPEMLIILSMLFTMTFITIGALNRDDNEAIKYILTHCALKVSPQAPESVERLGMPGRGGWREEWTRRWWSLESFHRGSFRTMFQWRLQLFLLISPHILLRIDRKGVGLPGVACDGGYSTWQPRENWLVNHLGWCHPKHK